MKLLLLLFLPIIGHCQRFQKVDSVLFKGANTIVFKAPVSDKEAFGSVGRAILGVGLEIAKSDDNFYVIESKWFRPEGRIFQMRVIVTILEGSVIIRGSTFYSGGSARIHHNPDWSSIPTRAFETFESISFAIAQKIESGPVFYAKD